MSVYFSICVVRRSQKDRESPRQPFNAQSLRTFPKYSQADVNLFVSLAFPTCCTTFRADEANHCVVNHTFADMHKEFKEDSVSFPQLAV